MDRVLTENEINIFKMWSFLTIRDCVLKVEERIYTLTKLIVYKLLETTSSIGKGEECSGQSHSIRGNGNQFSYFGKQFDIMSKS